jgi:hypothetical protein
MHNENQFRTGGSCLEAQQSLLRQGAPGPNWCVFINSFCFDPPMLLPRCSVHTTHPHTGNSVCMVAYCLSGASVNSSESEGRREGMGGGLLTHPPLCLIGLFCDNP